MSTEAPISPMTADATPRRKAATFASLTSDLRWRRPVPLDSREFQRVVASGKELRAPSSSSRRVGWRWLARPYGSQFPNRQTNSRLPSPKQRAQTARLDDSFYFAKCEIVESLLRRGARTHRVFCWPTGVTCIVRALAEIDQTT